MKKWLWAVVGVLIIGVAIFGVLIREDKKSGVPNPVIGLVMHASVESVTIKTDQGAEFTFVNRAQDISIDHLYEHQDEEMPVSITWQEENGAKVATSVADAP